MLEILETLQSHFQNILAGKLVGLYLHGSACLGGFHQESSDLDLLVVVKEKLTLQEKEELICLLLYHEPKYPAKGLEMSVVLLDEVKNPTPPIPFELHYSRMHLAKAKANPQYFAQKMHGVDDDLTVHLTITKARGRTLYGPAPQDIIGFISKQDYLQSILQDLIEGQNIIAENPSYYILNLCRTLAYLQEGLLLSKEDGGRWASHHLKSDQHLINQALEVREGKKVHFKTHELSSFYIKMMALIKEQAKRK